jgi:hypothetical protein
MYRAGSITRTKKWRYVPLPAKRESTRGGIGGDVMIEQKLLIQES